MKIRRFVAKDMKMALAQIKEELGVDAVIMSNKKIPEGVEIMAAVDYSQKTTPRAKDSAPTSANVNSAATQTTSGMRHIDNDVVSLSSKPNNASADVRSQTPKPDSLSALLNRDIQQTNIASHVEAHTHSEQYQSQNSQSTVMENKAQSPSIEQQLRNFTNRLQQSPNSESTNVQVNDDAATSVIEDHSPNTPIQDTAVQTPRSKQASVSVTPTDIETMQKEMHSIRQLLEHQMSGLMWQDMAQKNPQRALLINRLMGLGLTEEFAEQITGYIPNHNDQEQAWESAKQFITHQLQTTNNDIIHHGGVVALIGPTGVGKTTTVAKLAARFAQIHGADQVALISTDSFRIAGFEQLSTYGKIIGCQVKLAADAEALDTLLQQFVKKKLILIDTAGMGQRDMRLAKHLTTLIANARVRIRNYLVLSANTQQRVMQENVERFKKIPLAGCIYTKLDESLSIGEMITTSIQNGLPLGYLTDGQRVPEDIKVANANKLVTLADKMAEKVNNKNSSWRPMPIEAAIPSYQ